MVESFFANPLLSTEHVMDIARKSIELNVPFPGMQAQTDYLAPLNSLTGFVKTVRLDSTLSRGDAIMQLCTNHPSYVTLKERMIPSLFHHNAHMCGCVCVFN